MGTVTDRVRIASVQWQAGALDAAGVFTLCLHASEEPMKASDIAQRSDVHTPAFADHMRRDARTVENQCYVVTSGMTGQFHNVPELHGACAQSAILEHRATFPLPGTVSRHKPMRVRT